jgi:hypothetical protein
MRARLAEALTDTVRPVKLGSGRVAAICVALEEPFEASARHDDATAEAQCRKLPAGHEVVSVCSRDAEGRGGLGHGQNEPVVTLHQFTSEKGASDEAVPDDWRLKGRNATQSA